MQDKLYTTRVVAEMLGLHQNNVLRLVRDGKLRGVKQILRGKDKCPRIYVRASEIAKYINGLDAAGPPEPPARPERQYSRLPASLRAEPARRMWQKVPRMCRSLRAKANGAWIGKTIEIVDSEVSA